MLRAAALPLPLLLAGCLVKMEVPDPVYSPCRALSSTGWSAHVETVPTAHGRPILKPWLVVAGKVTVPGEGYEASLDLGPVEKLKEPVQQILVRTEGAQADALAAPVTRNVSGRFPARKTYRSVRIRCGDGTLATVAVSPLQS